MMPPWIICDKRAAVMGEAGVARIRESLDVALLEVVGFLDLFKLHAGIRLSRRKAWVEVAHLVTICT
jgi:hypothetical protein